MEYIDKIIQGDCLKVMPALPAGIFDMVLCDLPYGITARNTWDSIIPLELLWEQYRRLIKPTATLVFTAVQPFTTTLINSNPAWYKYNWVWMKSRPTGFLNANRAPLRAHEDIVIFCQSNPTYYPQGLIPFGKHYGGRGSASKLGRTGTNYGNTKAGLITKYTNYPRSVLIVPSLVHAQHPTQKPVELFSYLIKTYTQPGALILDNALGTGTTAIACKQTGRHFLGIELEPAYCAMANKRLLEGA